MGDVNRKFCDRCSAEEPKALVISDQFGGDDYCAGCFLKALKEETSDQIESINLEIQGLQEKKRTLIEFNTKVSGVKPGDISTMGDVGPLIEEKERLGI